MSDELDGRSPETTTTIWKEAMGKIDEWGVQATNNYNAARKREHQRAVDNGRQAPRPVLIHWRPPRDADHVRGFSSIGGARAVHSGSPAPDRDKNPKWNVSDLLRGITPKSMLTEWCAIFRTPQSIAKTVLHKFVGYLETQASERIWKPRCSATIAWEQTQGISVKDKTSKYTGPRGDWSQGYGYITHDGFCPCGASLATHEDRICPGATKNPRAADERLAATIVAQSQVPGRTVTDGWFTEEFGLMLTEWCAVFRTPQSVAKTVLHKFVGYLETQASERIWKPRCSATIAWEQTQGISVRDKTSKYTGPRGDWIQGYGYITHDGFCPCGASLATHKGWTCPEAIKDPRAADERLLESLATRIVAQSQVSDRTVTGGWFTEEFACSPFFVQMPPLCRSAT
ncbi:hypothetical protein BKA57DRAFT_509244 [Linnemannia elongata]|nr:hypothetical protein BKA57DRAFT_509244 [Linnemannia elongata]